MDNLNSILNFRQISPQLGTSGQPSAEQFAWIHDAGYQLVVNLALDSSDNGIKNEAQVVQGHGMEYIHIPVIWENPQMKDLKEFFRVMDQNQGRKIYVHCAMNMRVSVFVYLYRVLRQGVSSKAAWQNVLDIWEPNPTWQAFIDKALTK